MLVTGASGLLGRPLVKELVDRNLEVASLTSRPWERNHQIVQELFTACGVKHYTLDLYADAERGGPDLKSIIRSGGFDLVINLAADRGGVKFGGIKMAMNNYTLNTELPACLADIASELGVPVFLISSEYVWSGRGNSEQGYPAALIGTDDRFVGEVGSPYAIQKYQAEVLSERKLVHLGSGASITFIRIPLLYGKLITALEDGTACSSINNFLSTNTWRHDTWQRRYPTDAADAAFAVAALAKKRLEGGLRDSVYNYGSQARTSKYEFLATFAMEAGLPVEEVRSQNVGTFEEKKRPPYNVMLDINKTREELLSVGDWREPAVLCSQRIREVYIDWFADAIERRKLQQPTEVSKSQSEAPRRLSRPVPRELACVAATPCLNENLLGTTTPHAYDVSLSEFLARKRHLPSKDPPCIVTPKT